MKTGQYLAFKSVQPAAMPQNRVNTTHFPQYSELNLLKKYTKYIKSSVHHYFQQIGHNTIPITINNQSSLRFHKVEIKELQHLLVGQLLLQQLPLLQLWPSLLHHMQEGRQLHCMEVVQDKTHCVFLFKIKRLCIFKPERCQEQ